MYKVRTKKKKNRNWEERPERKKVVKVQLVLIPGRNGVKKVIDLHSRKFEQPYVLLSNKGSYIYIYIRVLTM